MAQGITLEIFAKFSNDLDLTAMKFDYDFHKNELASKDHADSRHRQLWIKKQTLETSFLTKFPSIDLFEHLSL